MRSLLLFLIAVFSIPLMHGNLRAQCISSSPYGSLVASGSVLTPQTIETCNYAGEYATIDIPSAGDWTFESSVGTDYFEITDASNVSLTSGTSPVTYTSTGAITIRLHIFADNSCATQNSCRVTTVTKEPCLSTSPYGSLTASGSSFLPQTIETCNYAEEYATVTLPSGGIWTFGSSVSTDFLVVTTTANAVLASGTQPVSYTATGPEVVRLHIFTDANCGTQSSCRVTTVTKSPCLASTMYPSSAVTADSTIGMTTNITTCNYAGEYSEVILPLEGNWEFASSDSSDFIVVTDLNDQVLASGVMPVQYSITSADTVRVHIFTDANCGTENSCRTTTVTRVPCFASTMYPSSVDTVNTDPSLMTITTCNYAGEYFEIVLITGQAYEITSSDTDDIFFFTDTANTFFFAEQTPVIANATGTGLLTLRAHIFTNTGCGTENTCRTTTIRCITCAPEMTPDSASVCDGQGMVTISTPDTLGTTYWFEGSCGGVPIDSGFSTDVTPNTSTWYYVANVYNGFASFCDSMEVTVNDNPTVSYSNVTDAACFGDMNGEATADPTGGESPYSYAWSNSGTMATATGLAAGEYYTTVTDANGCSSIDTVNIGEPDLLEAMISNVIDPLCNGDDNGEATAAGMGGTSPYTYAWSSGGSSATETGLAAGTYTVTITDDNGCTEEANEIVDEPDMLTNAFTSNDATCESGADGSIESDVAGGTGPYTYMWTDGSTTEDASDLAAGDYGLVVTDDNGCTFADSTTVGFMFADPTVPLGDTAMLCTGFDITLDAGNAGATFSWSNSETTQSIVVNTGGQYTVDVTDGNGCSTTHTVSVMEDACVGIDDVASVAVIETYPNPVNEVLNVRIKGSGSADIMVELISLSGQRIEARNINGGQQEVLEQFDVSNLSQGVYMMNFQIGSEVSTHRIIVH